MFRKIQSYLTPILLSHVEKYIKDFKTEDTQVSLWSGSVSLHNLELRPEIIQEELNLPFSLSSGHIHELLIQVPWMKIVSEPIVITINTIECILKLIDDKQTQNVTANTKNRDNIDTPPGYVQSLVQRIVSNISFRCHNIILKYVEEDIVVSINIKQFHLDNVDGNWVPTFAEMTVDDLHARKLIKLNNITLCLDKMNAAGKIETYLEPLLYKCELELRLESTYSDVLSKRPLNTRISIYSPKLEFGFSYQQIPMILRIFALFFALKQKKLGNFEDPSSSEGMQSVQSAKNENSSSSGWMWPMGNDVEQDSSTVIDTVILFSINFDKVTFSFKIPDITQDVSGIYSSQRKFRYSNICTLDLNYVSCESSSFGFERFCFRGGVQEVILYPENNCACGVSDVDSSSLQKNVYLQTIGCKKDHSLHWPVEYNAESAVATMKDEEILAICPAFALTYNYHLSIPDDIKKNMSLIPLDLEYSNFKEDVVINMVFGPLDAYICSGMVHRLSLIKAAADTYDYTPYYISKPMIKPSELPPPTTDDYDALSEHVPKNNLRISFTNPKFHIAIWDHFVSVKSIYDVNSGFPLINRRKISASATENTSIYGDKIKFLPSVLFELETLTISILKPMYPNRLTYVTCQLPEPPAIMLDACYKYNNINIANMQCFLVHKMKNEKKSSIEESGLKNYNETKTPFMTQCTFHFSHKHLLLQDYWTKNESVLHEDYNFNMENITICGTLAKILSAYHIFSSMIPRYEPSNQNNQSDVPQFSKNQLILMNTTLLNDAFEDNEMIHLDFNFEGLSIRGVFLKDIKTYRMVLNSIKVFAIGLSKGSSKPSDVKQVWIASAPESNNLLSLPLMKAVAQFSSNEDFSNFITFKIEECSLVMDPLLYQWLSYSYELSNSKTSPTFKSAAENTQTLQKRHSRRSLEEIVNRIGNTSRTLNRLSLGQSSSDREKDFVHGTPSNLLQSSQNNLSKEIPTSSQKDDVSKAESFDLKSFIKKYLHYVNTVLYLEIESITVYFPIEPVSALDYHSIMDAIKQNIVEGKCKNKAESIFVLRLPSVLLKTSNAKQNILPFCIYGLPVRLSSEVYDKSKTSYPWTVAIKNFSCHTLSCKVDGDSPTIGETQILKPLSSDLTISFNQRVHRRKHENYPKKSSTVQTPSSEQQKPSDEPNISTNVDGEKLKNLDSKPNKSSKFTSNKHISDTIGYKDLPEDLSSIGICIHVDTELISISLNHHQMILLNSIIHGNRELINILSHMYGKKKPNETPGSGYVLQTTDNYNSKQRNHSTSDINPDYLQEEDFSKDFDLIGSSCGTNIENVGEKSEANSSSETSKDVFVSAWIQWTISQIVFKAYAFSEKLKSSENGKAAQLKLLFTADDMVSSLDIQSEYLKWNAKVVTAAIHHYKRYEYNTPWKLGEFCGVILKERESMKVAAVENSFLYINITKARRSSVYNKWGDFCKAKQSQDADNSYISEIEISLQAVDIIVNLQSLEPFTFLFTSLSESFVNCQLSALEMTESDDANVHMNDTVNIAKNWDCRKLALCYFESCHPRIIMPIVSFTGKVENVLILQVDRISLLPVADNPVCRSPLRPDLYQQAARAGYLNVPGSEIEDRQCQFSIKGIYLCTTKWEQMEKSYALEMQQQPMVNENPALQWNNTLSRQPTSLLTMNITERVDICMVLALSMFHESELICGPCFDISIITDIDINLSIVQIKLIKTLVDEISLIIDDYKKRSIIVNGDAVNKFEKSFISMCPYDKYINKNALKYIREIKKVNVEHGTPIQSIDTGIASDIMSSFTNTSKSSSKCIKKISNYSKDGRLPSAVDYFDVFITFGKISVSVFETFPYDINRPIENQNCYKSLFNIDFHQPNFSYSVHHFMTKSQFSIFSVSVSLGDGIPRESMRCCKDFCTELLVTKPGIPDTVSGISPAFLTIKCEKNVGKKNFMKIDIKCPIRVILSLDTIKQLNKIKRLIFDLSSPFEKANSENVQESPLLQFKQFLVSFSSINFSTSQIVLSYFINNEQVVYSSISIQSLKYNVALNTRPERIINHGMVDSLAVFLSDGYGKTKILINPWTIAFDIEIIWESWQNIDLSPVDPLKRIYLQMDKLMIDLSPDHLKMLRSVFEYWNANGEMILSEVCKESPMENPQEDILQDAAVSASKSFWNQTTVNDQYYKDDLRAGAFKFIHGGSGYPLPYQVFVVPNGLLWRYPQPRTITRVYSFPIPFQIIPGSESKLHLNDMIACTLEYYSDLTNSFHYYAKFHIKQDDRVKLDHLKFDHCTVLSSMWRVVMHANEDNIVKKQFRRKLVNLDNNYSTHSDFDVWDDQWTKFFMWNKSSVDVVESEKHLFPVSPEALAASLRIDSYFTPLLVPNLQIAVDMSTIEMNFHSNFEQNLAVPLPDHLQSFQLDNRWHSPYVFCTFALSSAHLHCSVWNKNITILKVNSDVSCDVINHSDMILDRVVVCDDLSICTMIGEDYNENLNTVIHARRLKIHGGPHHTHMLNVGYKLWENDLSENDLLQSELSTMTKETCECCSNKLDVLMTKYLICNDTNACIRFGQVDTKENIILESRKSRMYSWRMPGSKHLLRFTVNQWNLMFSQGVNIETPGITNVELKQENDENNVNLIVLVEYINPIQLSVTIMGQLIIMNVLPVKFQMKLYQKKVLQFHGNGVPVVSLHGSSRSPSLLFDTASDTTIRLHYTKSDCGWSGNIPLKECSKGNIPWLVKVPIKGEMQYFSIWCRVIIDKYKRTLVILSPLYVIKSHLPIRIMIKLETEECSETIEQSVDGKGSLHYLTCPGTKQTKHSMIIMNVEDTDVNEVNKIPLHYDLVDQSDFFAKKDESLDIDTILKNMKQWIDNENDQEWPYIFSEDGLQWKPVGHQYNTDIIVRYLPAVHCIDSLIVDMAPWALFGNCTGVDICLQGMNGEELSLINHKEVVIPPPAFIREQFVCRISLSDETYLSGPLYVSSSTLGPYERNPKGCISFEHDSMLTVECIHSMYIFVMAYEMRNNIKIFRLSSRYVFINQLPNNIVVLPIAMYNWLDGVYIPDNVNDLCVKVPSTENSSVGTPLNRFHILPTSLEEKKERDDEDDNFLFYIYLRGTDDDCFSCPVRIDKFLQRQSISLKINQASIPIVLSCQEYRGQVYVTVHKDTTPQFLIRNNANIPIVTAQVLKEFVTSDTYNYDTKQEFLPKTVVQECWKSDWYCRINPGDEIFYTMPTQNSQYPELFATSSFGVEDNLYLTFAYVKNCDDGDDYTWSVPVDVSANGSERFVKLPGYFEDIKVMVNSHCYATTVTINNVTHDDISASDIRKRLLMNAPVVEESENESEEEITSSTCLLDENQTIGRGIELLNENNVSLHAPLIIAQKQQFNDLKVNKFLKSMKLTMILDNLDICMTTDKNLKNVHKNQDVISVICDNVALTSIPNNKGYSMSLIVNDLQIDNPLFPNGGFDFHVIMLKQKTAQMNTNVSADWKPMMMSQIRNVSKVVETLRNGCIFACDAQVEIWDDNLTIYSGLSDLNITMGSVSLYLEDTYVSALLDYVTDFIPAYATSSCSHFRIENDNRISMISVPKYITWEAYAIAHPIKLRRLLINPLSILLSLHSSMMLYLALDHSPLQFAKFDRINVLTSSYRLGNALTMHYLSEAIFGAGWVIGSLEILGSPSGLARRVSAGLRDLVREPCRGLMRGPWGFLVGMTHGSASLLKHLTQGTVESMSMVMGSFARNLDRLSLDEEHMRRTERARRYKPRGLVQALTRGLQGLGLSLLGAIGGIAHEALVVGYVQGGGPAAIAAGLTRGLVGVITKPLSATADFLALTGQGLLCQAGWDQYPTPRWSPDGHETNMSKNENIRLKLGNVFANSSLLYICQGINKDTASSITIVVTDEYMILLDTHDDKVIEKAELECWRIVHRDHNGKNGEIILALKQGVLKQPNNSSNAKLEPELQMDPALRARIAAYVGVIENNHFEEKLYRLTLPTYYFYHCTSMISFARYHSLNQGFSVLE